MKIGDWISVNEPDYKYGTGTLVMQLTWIENNRDEWIEVKGTSRYWNGERWALIRQAGVVHVGQPQ